MPPEPFAPVFICIVIGWWIHLYRRRTERRVLLSADGFWNLVRSQDHPVVFLGTGGVLLKRTFYIFPYQGMLFATRSADTTAPEGIRLIGAGEAFTAL